MDRNNHGLSGKAFFYCRNGVKWHFDGNMIAEKRRKKSDVSYDDFSRNLSVKINDVLYYFKTK